MQVTANPAMIAFIKNKSIDFPKFSLPYFNRYVHHIAMHIVRVIMMMGIYCNGICSLHPKELNISWMFTNIFWITFATNMMIDTNHMVCRSHHHM